MRRFDPGPKYDEKTDSRQQYVLEFPEGSAEFQEVFDVIRILASDACRGNVFPVHVRVLHGNEVGDHRLLRVPDRSTKWESTVLLPSTSTPKRNSSSVVIDMPSDLRTIPKQVPSVINTVRRLNRIVKIINNMKKTSANNLFFFQPAPLLSVEEQKKGGAYSKHTPLQGSKAIKKDEEKTSQKKLFESSQPDGKEDSSLLSRVTSSDVAALNSGDPSHQSLSFSGTLDIMELTCLPPATPDDQAGAVGDEKKDWAQLVEEDTFAMNPGLDSIAEEKTLEEEEIIEEDAISEEEEKIIEEDVTTSFVSPSGLASSLFWPIRSLSGNNFPYFPDNFLDNFPLPLSSNLYIIPPVYLFSAI